MGDSNVSGTTTPAPDKGQENHSLSWTSKHNILCISGFHYTFWPLESLKNKFPWGSNDACHLGKFINQSLGNNELWGLPAMCRHCLFWLPEKLSAMDTYQPIQVTTAAKYQMENVGSFSHLDSWLCSEQWMPETDAICWILIFCLLLQLLRSNHFFNIMQFFQNELAGPPWMWLPSLAWSCPGYSSAFGEWTNRWEDFSFTIFQINKYNCLNRCSKQELAEADESRATGLQYFFLTCRRNAI